MVIKKQNFKKISDFKRVNLEYLYKLQNSNNYSNLDNYKKINIIKNGKSMRLFDYVNLSFDHFSKDYNKKEEYRYKSNNIYTKS
ncbi:MAG: hypothetical protein ACLFPJ_04930 [Candidatus Woesearchaeota archaeon]